MTKTTTTTNTCFTVHLIDMQTFIYLTYICVHAGSRSKIDFLHMNSHAYGFNNLQTDLPYVHGSVCVCQCAIFFFSPLAGILSLVWVLLSGAIQWKDTTEADTYNTHICNICMVAWIKTKWKRTMNEVCEEKKTEPEYGREKRIMNRWMRTKKELNEWKKNMEMENAPGNKINRTFFSLWLCAWFEE